MENNFDIEAAKEKHIESLQEVTPVMLTPQTDVRNGIRRAGNVIGIALIALFAAMFTVSLLIDAFVTPVYGVTDPLTGVTQLDDTSTVYYITYCIQYFLMFSVPIIIMAAAGRGMHLFRALKRTQKGEERIAEGKKRLCMLYELPLLCIVTLATAYLMNVVSLYIEQAFNMIGLVSPEIFANSPSSPTGWVFYFITLCVAAPLCEEMVFRGAIMNMLKPYGAGFAIAAQAVLFGIFHGSLIQILYTTIGGLIFGYVAHRYGGILPTVILHALNNGLSIVISEFVPENENMQLTVVINIAVYAVAVIAALAALKIITSANKGFAKVGGASEADGMEGFSAFRTLFTRPAVIVFMCLELGLMLLNMLVTGINQLLESGALDGAVGEVMAHGMTLLL